MKEIYKAAKKDKGETLFNLLYDIYELKGQNTNDIIALNEGIEKNGYENIIFYPKGWKIPDEITHILIKKGINIDTEDKNKNLTALHIAAQSNCVDNIKILVNFGADINVQDSKYGNTPLHLAFQKGNREAIYYLYKLGAKDQLNNESKLPYELSADYENDRIMELNKTTNKFIHQTKLNLQTELKTIVNPSTKKFLPVKALKDKIFFLNQEIEDIGTQGLFSKMQNSRYYKDNQYNTHKNEILKLLQVSYKQDKPNDKKEWFILKVKVMIKSYEEELQNVINPLAEELKDLAPPIIWGIPKIINGPDNEYIDALIYPGSTKEKTVYIPFTNIHKKLIEANLIMSGGIDHIPNYLIAHLVFIISDQPHIKNEKGKYIGSRRFIDFPIITSPEQAGTYSGECLKNKHSEEVLKRFLEDSDNIESIVSNIKEKIKKISNNGPHKNFKIYEVCLFINSQKNICGGVSPEPFTNPYGRVIHPHINNCEGALKQLMSSQHEGSFLFQLKAELEKQGLKTHSKSNNKFPYMFISVSAHKYYTYWCSSRLREDARVLDSENELATNNDEHVDIKNLAGKVILSTHEKWIDRISKNERQ